MATRRRTSSIADIGEFGFLSRLLPRLPRLSRTRVGPGHDCAVIQSTGRSLLFTVDALVEGVHFEDGWMSARQIGRKSFLVNASDVAAMGGTPRFCVVNLGVPPTYPAKDLFALEAGIVAAARDCGTAVVGGNLTRAQQLSVSIALLADAPSRIVTRAGARPGDRLYVTGTLGDAALAVQVLRMRGVARAAGALIRRFREPTPRLQAGRVLTELGIVSAMIDISDGLMQDVGHLCEQSQVGAVIYAAAVPRSAAYRRLAPDGSGAPPLALHGGEDYELLCTVPKRNVKRLERHRARLGCPITCVGEVRAGRRLTLIDESGRMVMLDSTGYDHFRSSVQRRA